MKTKSTAIWFVIAAILFAAIWIFQKVHAPAPVNMALLPGLRPADVTGVEIVPAGALAVSADFINGVWQLEKPFPYPAQTAAIQALLERLSKLTPVLRLTAADMNKNAGAGFGFDHPQFSIILTANGRQWQLDVGNRTAPGDGVYVRVVGVEGAFITGVDWLQWLPREATAWRNTSLVAAAGQFDAIIITNGTKTINLKLDATNRLWRMTYPLTARANGLSIVAALEQLRAAHVSQFVTDDPKADLTAFGLQPAELDLWLGSGTNLTAGIHLGKNSTNDPAQVYARIDGWYSIVTVPKNIFEAWRGSVNDLRDPNLIELTAPVAAIEVSGTNAFTLQQRGSNDWTVAGEKFPVDPEVVRSFIRQLANLHVAEFGKDNNTLKDLQDVGLITPSKQITLYSVAGDTNSIIAQLQFGTGDTNKIYVKRADENFVYAIARESFNELPEAGWQFRDHRIWNFTATNVAEITLHQNGKTRVLLHTGENQWALGAGSQGIQDSPAAVEETVFRLGQLTALAWFRHDFPTPEQDGFNKDNLQIVVGLKTGERFTLDFGGAAATTGIAAVTLDDGRWEFVVDPTLYQLIKLSLTIPSTAP
jgi:hypothetical protein